jgi:DNA-binding protein YbaB
MANFLQMAQKAAQFKTKLRDVQDRVRGTELTGIAPGVTCRIDGRFKVTGLEIDDALHAGDKDKMTRHIIAALNDGRDKAEKLMADEMKALMDDLGLPPGFDLPI